MLFGLAPFQQNRGLVNAISCFENLRSSILTFSFARLNLPYSAAARNFGFTISAFKKLGGFGNTLETQSGDDDLLIREAVKNKLKIGVVDFEESYVISNPKSSLNEFPKSKSETYKNLTLLFTDSPVFTWSLAFIKHTFSRIHLVFSNKSLVCFTFYNQDAD